MPTSADCRRARKNEGRSVCKKGRWCLHRASNRWGCDASFFHHFSLNFVAHCNGGNDANEDGVVGADNEEEDDPSSLLSCFAQGLFCRVAVMCLVRVLE